MKSGPKITFDETNHKYTVDGETDILSVTELVGTIYPFDAPAVAAKLAERGRKTAEEWLAEWQYAADRGTRTHAVAEACVRHKARPVGLKSEQPYYEAAKRAVAEMRRAVLARGLKFRANAELRVGTRLANVAGTIDLLVDLGDNHWLLLDYKTCDKLPQEKLDKYSLQLSLYKQILLKEYLPEGAVITSYICHIVRCGDECFFKFIGPEPAANGDGRHLIDQDALAKKLLNDRYLSAKARAKAA